MFIFKTFLMLIITLGVVNVGLYLSNKFYEFSKRWSIFYYVLFNLLIVSAVIYKLLEVGKTGSP